MLYVGGATQSGRTSSMQNINIRGFITWIQLSYEILSQRSQQSSVKSNRSVVADWPFTRSCYSFLWGGRGVQLVNGWHIFQAFWSVWKIIRRKTRSMRYVPQGSKRQIARQPLLFNVSPKFSLGFFSHGSAFGIIGFRVYLSIFFSQHSGMCNSNDITSDKAVL